jgi:hypothetical protein
LSFINLKLYQRPFSIIHGNYFSRTGIFNNEIDAIWTYNASSQLWEQIGEFDYFERGRGYWIHAKTDCEWEVPL